MTDSELKFDKRSSQQVYSFYSPPPPNIKIIPPWATKGEFYYQMNGKYPNWLWRKMAYLLLGLRYEKI